MTTNNPFHYFILGLKKSADFRGRTRRRDFWYFFLSLEIINLMLFFLKSILEGMNNQLYIFFDIIQVIFSVIVILPYFAVSIRRMHDINRSGWWVLLPIVNIVFSCQDSDPQTNRFGPSPKPRENMLQYKENVFSGGVVSSDNLDKIEKLARLRDQGILTEEEFQRQKKELL